MPEQQQWKAPEPEEMREILEKVAQKYTWDSRERECIFYMIGYYKIDYKEGDE